MGSSASVDSKYNVEKQIVYVNDYMNCENISELYKRLSWVNKRFSVYLSMDDKMMLVQDGIEYFIENEKKYTFHNKLLILFLLLYFKLFDNILVYRTIKKCFSFYSLYFLTDLEFVNIMLNLNVNYIKLLMKCVKDSEELFTILKNLGDYFIDYYILFVKQYIEYISIDKKEEDIEIFKEMINYIHNINENNTFKNVFIDIIMYIKSIHFNELLNVLCLINNDYFINLIDTP